MAPLLSLSFPDSQGHIFTASDTVQGHVDFRLDDQIDRKTGKNKFDTIHAKLRCVLVSHYHHETPARHGDKPTERKVGEFGRERGEGEGLSGHSPVLVSALSWANRDQDGDGSACMFP